MSEDYSPDADAVEQEEPPGNRLDGWVDGQRLVIHVLPGSNRAVRCFAGSILLVVGLLGFFTWEALHGRGDDPIGGLVVLGVAWVFVAPMAGAWVFARFGATSVLVEQDRLVIEQRLLGWVGQKEYRLALCSKATLAACYRLSGDLIYGVRIGAIGEQPVFGQWLLEPEKNWIARQINRHLHHGDSSEPEVNPNTEVEWAMMDGFTFGGD